ncbi:MAG: cobalamin-binding protein [Gammaproteobacteria bacterium]|nr:cobalamin-binding protein [Gammaproteobacteria bacterium]
MRVWQFNKRLISGLCLVLLVLPVRAELFFTDDQGKTISLNKPAKRIISLAPHITENLFAAGAGQYIVGVVAYSDFPPEANRIKQIGSYKKIDVEAVVALKPDIIIAWGAGNDELQIEQFRKLGIPVYVEDPRKIQDIADSIEDYGRMVNNMHEAIEVAREFRLRYRDIRKKYSARARLRGFYQVWNKPLITINDQHLITDVMNVCSIDNMYGELTQLAPRITIESVIEKDPQMIIASGMGEAKPEWLDDWRKWNQLQAVQYNNLYFIPPAIIQRHAPRILDAAERLCEQAEEARRNFSKPKATSITSTK